jgi:geranylgeranyl reductase family protein
VVLLGETRRHFGLFRWCPQACNKNASSALRRERRIRLKAVTCFGRRFPQNGRLTDIFDVAIVGAGPAGSIAAFELARGGATVALIDDSHPREKPCGGGLTARALALVGSSVAALSGGVPIEAAGFAHGRRHARVQLADEAGLLRLAVASRRSFDSRLVEIARAAGATLLPIRTVDVHRHDAEWRLTTRGAPVTARFLIGADGPGSLVRRRLTLPFQRRDLSIAAGYYVHGLTSQQIEVAFIDDPSGYLWSFPRPDHLAVGVCAQADVSKSTQLLDLCGDWINANAGGGRRQRYGWSIPSLTEATLCREYPAGDGWMLVGDAAGLVDPITREGIYFALLSGRLAAESILSGVDPGALYVRQLRARIYPELLAAARLKARFYRPGFVGLLISSLQRSGRIRAIMADLVAGEQPYHSLRGRLLRTFEWRLMTELLASR